MSTWSEFIQRSTEGAPDDAFTTLLRRRLAAGARVVNVRLKPEATAYVLLLERLRELSEMELPHSEAFTRWSMEAGARVEPWPDEARRFSWVAKDKLAPLRRLDPDGFDAALAAVLESLGPPGALRVLATRKLSVAEPKLESLRTTNAIRDALASLARDLTTALRYDEETAAAVLDEALSLYVRSV